MRELHSGDINISNMVFRLGVTNDGNVMSVIYWMIKAILYFPRKAHYCLTHCLASKTCFTSWTWCKL